MTGGARHVLDTGLRRIAPARAEVEKIVRAAIADIPPRSAPADYTRFFAENDLVIAHPDPHRLGPGP